LKTSKLIIKIENQLKNRKIYLKR